MGRADGNERYACLLDQLTGLFQSMSPLSPDKNGLLYVASEVDRSKPQV